MLRSDRHSRRSLSGATGRKSTLIQMLMIDGALERMESLLVKHTDAEKPRTLLYYKYKPLYSLSVPYQPRITRNSFFN